jgi:hypothetical protein
MHTRVVSMSPRPRRSFVCKPSVVTEDWITKGMHIHVKGVELNIFTTHKKSGFGFRAVFSTTNPKRLQAALKHVRKKCLPDRNVRRRWISRLNMATIYMRNYQGVYARMANGRMYDFKLIRIAIERWGEKYGDP